MKAYRGFIAHIGDLQVTKWTKRMNKKNHEDINVSATNVIINFTSKDKIESRVLFFNCKFFILDY